MLDLCKFLGVEVDEEFEIQGYKYKVMQDNLLYFEKQKWVISQIELNELMASNIKRLPWKPKFNEMYWFLSVESESGIEVYTWEDDIVDSRTYQRTTLYKTREEAQEAVKALGWEIE